MRRLLALVVSSALVLFGLFAMSAAPAQAATTITNGGFETGTLSGWTASGAVTGVTTTNPHSGTYAAMLGNTSPSNGDSSIAQSFTGPSGGSTLSFWYDVVCPDTVTYDWATATLTNTTTNTTSTLLPKTCVNPSSGWTQVSTSVTGGDNYTLTLTSHDDNWPGDPTYTEYDDVALSGGVPTNDFSITASPTSGTVNAGGSTSSTISTAVTSGSAQSVTLSDSGLPSGASATFSTNPVTAGGSSTLTVSTTSSTPSGTYPITITGTGASATHTATFTLTVSGSGSSLQEVSTDPYTDSDAQHQTEVEPDTYAYGNTVVAAYQVGRVYGGGASNLGYSVSTNAGVTWTSGDLPGITVNDGGSYAQVSDASVVYDAKYSVWLVAGLPIDSSGNAAGILVNRSTNGGTSWSNPVNAVGFDGQGYDKQWITCDNTSTSPHYGNCYIEADNTSQGNAELMSTSSDGGQTWGAAQNPSGGPSGLGGQPLVQPNGTVIVPFSTNGSAIESFTSTDGGSSWGNVTTVAQVQVHTANGNLRDGSGLPSAAIDASGKVYVVWQDCRFRSGCPGNDMVMSTSTDGSTWSAVTRIPIDAVTSGTDHFIPGIGVDRSTSGSTAKLGLYYYQYANANCTTSTCEMSVGFISSANGGSSWGTAQTLGSPMTMAQIASTSQGSMVGDYMSCSVINGKSIALFAIGKAPTGGQAFDEGMYTMGGGLAMTGGPVHVDHGPTYPSPVQPHGNSHRALK